jgi:enoyl-CoA hydratase
LTVTLVSHVIEDGVAEIRMDDGRRNALGPALLDQLMGAIEAAERENSAILIIGRPGTFCAGFDVEVIRQGPEKTREMTSQGAELWVRLLTCSRPVVMACTGHAVAAGAVLLCTADWRIAASGDYKIGLSEVELGLPLQGVPLELVRARLSKRHFERATLLAQIYGPEAAVDAGWVDETVSVDEIMDRARELAHRYASLPAAAFARTKKQSRRVLADTVRKMMAKGAKGTDVFSALRTGSPA